MYDKLIIFAKLKTERTELYRGIQSIHIKSCINLMILYNQCKKKVLDKQEARTAVAGIAGIKPQQAAAVLRSA